MLRNFTLHHVGVAVPDLEQASDFYTKAFGFRIVAGPLEDPIQKVRAIFMTQSGPAAPLLELITPANDESPVNTYLTQGVGAYHVCYEVGEIADALSELRAQGCLIISRPVPGTAYEGRKIAWCFTPTKQLVELLERATGGER
jgi:methylmalonyl-CoA/ethylmalonyl-CoA epimerase